MYSQNQEEHFITSYFTQKGNLLSIGENDGKTFSNSLRLIELGWGGVLIEPAPIAFDKMQALHKDNPKILCLQLAITEKDGEVDFWDSGAHIGNGDTSLLSTAVETELERWKDTNNEFKPIKVQGITIATLINNIGNNAYDFINIDAEGLDIAILKQLNLEFCKMICIEWNLNQDIKTEIIEYCAKFGLTNLIYQSGENLILAR